MKRSPPLHMLPLQITFTPEKKGEEKREVAAWLRLYLSPSLLTAAAAAV